MKAMFNKRKNISAQEPLPTNPAEESVSRMLLLKIGLLVFFAVVAARLVWIQVIQAPKYKEIAKRMECSIGTVMSRLFYARRKMANLMAGYKREELS